MRVCQKCQIVKFDWQMYKERFCNQCGCIYETTWVCKDCANKIAMEAVKELLKQD